MRLSRGRGAARFLPGCLVVWAMASDVTGSGMTVNTGDASAADQFNVVIHAQVSCWARPTLHYRSQGGMKVLGEGGTLPTFLSRASGGHRHINLGFFNVDARPHPVSSPAGLRVLSIAAEILTPGIIDPRPRLLAHNEFTREVARLAYPQEPIGLFSSKDSFLFPGFSLNVNS